MGEVIYGDGINPLGAASERERIKNAEYAERYNRQDIHFLPVVMETAGGLGTSAQSFVKSLAQDAYLSGCESIIEGRVESFVRKVLAASLQVGNALLSMEGWRRSRMKYSI